MKQLEKNKISRLQVELHEEIIKAIDLQKDDLGINTRKEYVKAALSSFAWMVREKKKGRSIASINSDSSYNELMMPCFDCIRPEIYDRPETGSEGEPE